MCKRYYENVILSNLIFSFFLLIERFLKMRFLCINNIYILQQQQKNRPLDKTFPLQYFFFTNFIFLFKEENAHLGKAQNDSSNTQEGRNILHNNAQAKPKRSSQS